MGVQPQDTEDTMHQHTQREGGGHRGVAVREGKAVHGKQVKMIALRQCTMREGDKMSLCHPHEC